MANEWDFSTDIYDIVGTLNNLKKRYIDNESETTLALGIFGYKTDVEAKKIQSATIMAGQMGNEMFPTRAKLTKNVLSHAIYSNIEDINAIPSHMVINIGIKVSDFINNKIDNKFIFDHMCPIFIGEYEFHFDYDIILSRTDVGSDKYVYSARYDIDEDNRLSDVVDPYLKQPFVIRIDNFDYIILQAVVRQITIEDTIDKIISNSVIENKTYTFEFDNQIADFDVYVTENNEKTRLTPLPYGSSSDNIKNYCWYLFISDNTIRITFDSKSYIPGLNADILIRAYTTLGADGRFNYKKIDESSDGFFIDLSSEKYGYTGITCYAVAATDSVDGTNRKTKAELQKLIPKAALSRGALTTETDIANYFNLIDNEDNRLEMRKKVQNQMSTVWFGYFLLKDANNNIIPANTVQLKISSNLDDGYVKLSEDGRYILPAGTIIKYNNEDKIGIIIDESEVPELYSDEYFGDDYYYMTVYNIIINPDPLYAAFYLTISNTDSFFSFNWVNDSAPLQFVTTMCNFQRNLLTDQNIYKLSFKMAQSISTDFGMYYEEEIVETDASGNTINKTLVTNNMKCILVLRKDNTPYRWTEVDLVEYFEDGYRSSWMVELESDNGLDDKNRIKILNLHEAGSKDNINYAFFDGNTKASLYILAKFGGEESYRYNLDGIAPGYEGYTVTNIYDIDGGLTFYENFTNVLDTKIDVSEDDPESLNITGIPVVGLHYMINEEYADYFVDAMSERKAYIDYCLRLLENPMKIDFKLFNTYGPARTYTLGDKEKTLIGHVDLSMKFRVSLKNASDIYTKDELIAYIKKYVENLNETGDWHAPNMVADIMNQFSNRINYIEFMNYNNFRLGIQHIELITIDDPNIVPEFLNIRNRFNIEGELEPCIDIEVSY